MLRIVVFHIHMLIDLMFCIVWLHPTYAARYVFDEIPERTHIMFLGLCKLYFNYKYVAMIN